jgi:hypothetical protein
MAKHFGPPGRSAGITLDELAAKIDAHVGWQTGFAEAVRDYRHCADTITALDSRGKVRAPVAEMLDRIIKTEHNIVGRQRFVRKIKGGGRRLALPSNIVKHENLDLWTASCLSNQNVYISGMAGPVIGGVTIPGRAVDVWELHQRLIRKLSSAGEQRSTARSQILAALDDYSMIWSGQPARVTTDGWSIGVSWVTRFNEKECRKTAAARGIDVSNMESIRTIPERVVYELEDMDCSDGEVDLDGD